MSTPAVSCRCTPGPADPRRPTAERVRDVIAIISAPPTPGSRAAWVDDRWRPQLAAARRWRPGSGPTLVVVPHPDDESLSSGGLIAHLRRRGGDVTVLAVTDGEAAYPDRADPAALGRLRRAEQRRALTRLGVSERATVRAGIPDGRVAGHEAALARLIRRVATQAAVGTIVAPWTGDHHADHEACGRAAASAAAGLGTELVGGIFWGYHFSGPPAEADGRLVRLPLAARERRAKRAALAEHRSQTAAGVGAVPVLDEAALEPARWRSEFFVRGDARGDAGARR